MTAAPALVAHAVRPLRPGEVCSETVVLSYDDRLIRRKRLTCASGRALMVDLPQTVDLDEGFVLVAGSGEAIGVVAADEELLAVTGPVAQLAWHIGNRHTPCEITEDRIVIRAERVMAEMLAGLGATVSPLRGPFRPGGGAYGHGRTMGHSHAAAQGSGHGDSHGHGHSHGHMHAQDHGADQAHGDLGPESGPEHGPELGHEH